MAINPMDKAHAAPRCAAKSKRSGLQCQAPAMRGKRVCHIHGGKSPGAPCGDLLAATFTGAKPSRRRTPGRRSRPYPGRTAGGGIVLIGRKREEAGRYAGDDLLSPETTLSLLLVPQASTYAFWVKCYHREVDDR